MADGFLGMRRRSALRMMDGSCPGCALTMFATCSPAARRVAGVVPSASSSTGLLRSGGGKGGGGGGGFSTGNSTSADAYMRARRTLEQGEELLEPRSSDFAHSDAVCST